MIVATTFFNHPHIKGEIKFREKGSKVEVLKVQKIARMVAQDLRRDTSEI